MMRNSELRQVISDNKIRMWELAAEIGIDPSTLCRWFRFEISTYPEREKRVEQALTKLIG